MYSVTQTSNYTALAGMVVIILKFFGLDIPEADIVTLIAGAAILGGIITSILNRYAKGDVTITGKKL